MVPEQTSCSIELASGALLPAITSLVKGLGRGQKASWQGQLPCSCIPGWPDDWAPHCCVQVHVTPAKPSGLLTSVLTGV